MNTSINHISAVSTLRVAKLGLHSVQINSFPTITMAHIVLRKEMKGNERLPHYKQ